MWSTIEEAIKRYLLAPFSNKVTRTLLFIGGSLLIFPTVEYLLVDLLIQKIFGISTGFDYPSTGSFISGVIILLIASVHDVAFQVVRKQSDSVEIEISGNRVTGTFNAEEVIGLISGAPISGDISLDYDKLVEKYQPLITDAVIKIDQGRLEQGKDLLHQVLNELPIGIIGTAYLNYGYYHSAKNSSDGEEYYQVALRIFKDLGYKSGMAAIYKNLGETARLKHDFIRAEELQKKAVELLRELDDEIGLADAISSLGLVYAHQCKHSEAEALFGEAISIFQQHQADSQVRRVRSYIDTMRSCPNY
jgi:tetratricopeptide (TPR) repeat protein